MQDRGEPQGAAAVADYRSGATLAFAGVLLLGSTADRRSGPARRRSRPRSAVALLVFGGFLVAARAGHRCCAPATPAAAASSISRPASIRSTSPRSTARCRRSNPAAAGADLLADVVADAGGGALPAQPRRRGPTGSPRSRAPTAATASWSPATARGRCSGASSAPRPAARGAGLRRRRPALGCGSTPTGRVIAANAAAQALASGRPASSSELLADLPLRPERGAPAGRAPGTRCARSPSAKATAAATCC